MHGALAVKLSSMQQSQRIDKTLIELSLSVYFENFMYSMTYSELCYYINQLLFVVECDV